MAFVELGSILFKDIQISKTYLEDTVEVRFLGLECRGMTPLSIRRCVAPDAGALPLRRFPSQR